jgi:hypothetical protein
MKAAVSVDGTLNKRDDEDKKWTAELAIPIEAAKGKEKEMKNVPPKVGTEWRVNFFRMDQPNGRPQSGTGWSPPMVGDFHALEKFGILVFGDEKGKAPTVAATPPSGEPAKKADEKTPAEKKGAEKKAEGEKAPAKKNMANQAFNPPATK